MFHLSFVLRRSNTSTKLSSPSSFQHINRTFFSFELLINVSLLLRPPSFILSPSRTSTKTSLLLLQPSRTSTVVCNFKNSHVISVVNIYTITKSEKLRLVTVDAANFQPSSSFFETPFQIARNKNGDHICS